MLQNGVVLMLLAICLAGCGARSDIQADPIASLRVNSDASSSDVLAERDVVSPDHTDASADDDGDSTRSAGTSRWWATSSCPGLGCPKETVCVKQRAGDGDVGSLGCAPIPSSCNGTGTCACMSCVCDVSSCDDQSLPGELVCS
jgi:hypothetical protein